MGWSYSQKAGCTMDAIEAACKQTREGTGERSSNVFVVRDKRYFYETTRKDQPDGGITGSIYRFVGGDKARKVGIFRVDGQGKVIRGPAMFRHARPTENGRWS